ncbi:SOS response-associated peptidase [Pseudactinotalea sp. HY160]|uniref:SOS response-associated peptidase n=1 Tax=Pseudactinotalea sp. HY160 TaxID=2654490 RepID=UPI00128B3DA1|nr:SOS response-associated peptidase [Pseudactinotalea sp. HY160]MPV50178.1 SOS response-associated peptidase [Pseudactinotalea sp. HY160]
MCGRYASFRAAQAMADAFDVDDMTDAARAIAASWNVAPTDPVRIVVAHPGSRRSLQAARWGLVPPWATSPAIGSRMINARSETLADKPAFRIPAAKQRCLVLADGYYEWHRYTPAPDSPDSTGSTGSTSAAGSTDRRSGELRQPYYIHPAGEAPLAFAGLYSWWPDPELPAGDPQRWLLSTTIVTGEARGALATLHAREPVVLGAAAARAWLDPELTDARAALELTCEPGPRLTWHPVTRAVGAVRNNHPGLLEAVTSPPELAGLPLREDDVARPGRDAPPRAGA